jgi:hypothetical protein
MIGWPRRAAVGCARSRPSRPVCIRMAPRFARPLPWSKGQAEGPMTNLKMMKRQMYGRANFDLLRRRILLAA